MNADQQNTGASSVEASPPAVSVVMSVWNGERYLPQAVESILEQSFRDFEFIIIDDGSTDGSLRILKGFAARDKRIRLVTRENRGLTISLNESIALAGGEFIARMDADDISLPARFAGQVAYLREHPDCVIVGAEVMLMDQDGDSLCLRGHPQSHDLIDRACLLGRVDALTHPVVMMRKSALEKIGGYNAAIKLEDLDLFLRLCEVGKAHNLPQVYLRYRQHLQSVNSKVFQDWDKVNRLVVGMAIQRRGVEGYLQGVFCGAEGGFLQNQTFSERCIEQAVSGGNFRTAFKHLRRTVADRGLRACDVRKFARICLLTLKIKSRSLFHAQPAH